MLYIALIRLDFIIFSQTDTLFLLQFMRSGLFMYYHTKDANEYTMLILFSAV